MATKAQPDHKCSRRSYNKEVPGTVTVSIDSRHCLYSLSQIALRQETVRLWGKDRFKTLIEAFRSSLVGMFTRLS